MEYLIVEHQVIMLLNVFIMSWVPSDPQSYGRHSNNPSKDGRGTYRIKLKQNQRAQIGFMSK